jgi:hypothetical protein
MRAKMPVQTFKEYVDLQESMWSGLAGLLQKSGADQSLPGNTPEEKLDYAADALHLALDAGGIADPTGIVDGTNGVLYLLRAVAQKERWPEHVKNALISFVSIIPFGDLVKLVKAKKGIQWAKTAATGARAVKTAGANARAGRMAAAVA